MTALWQAHPPEGAVDLPELLTQRLRMIWSLSDRALEDCDPHTDPQHQRLRGFAALLAELARDLHWLLAGDDVQQARAALDATDTHDESTARLLTAVWTAGLGEGVTPQMWQQAAPELPALCARAAARARPVAD